MPKVCRTSTPAGEFVGWMIECPGCQCAHVFDSRWTFNGDEEHPTFRPSLLVHESKANPEMQPRCHSFVTDGKIQFLADSTHALSNQTVELPEIEK